MFTDLFLYLIFCVLVAQMAFSTAIRPAIRPCARAFHAMSAVRFPPHFASTDHRQRCLEQMRSKAVSLEKYIYLNGLKGRDSNLFYDILLGNMSVRTPDTARPAPDSPRVPRK